MMVPIYVLVCLGISTGFVITGAYFLGCTHGIRWHMDLIKRDPK